MNRRILLLNSLMFLLASFNIMARNCNDLFLKQYIVTNDTVVIKKLGHSFLKYHIQRDSVYTLEWGNELVENTSKDIM